MRTFTCGLRPAAILVVVLLTPSLGTASAQDRDRGNCSVDSVAGTWAYTETGTVFRPTGAVPYASVGKFTVDAHGNLWGQRTASAGGSIQQATIKGTATVTSDCTGTQTLAFYDPQSGSLLTKARKFLVYDDKLTEFRAIITLAELPDGASVPAVLTTDGRKLVPGRTQMARCSTASVAGTWGWTVTGTLYLPTGPAAVARVGRTTADAGGNFSATLTASTGGTVSELAMKGTWAVKRDCTGTLTVSVYRSGNLAATQTWDIVYDDNERELRAILTSVVLGPSGTSQPAVITMTGRKQ